MTHYIVSCFILFSLFTMNNLYTKAQPLQYPETRKTDVVDEYFGTNVADPYRWLEDDRSKETADWVKAENKVTFNYLQKISYRKELEKRLTGLWNYERISKPVKHGTYFYFSKNNGLQNQDVLYRKKTMESLPELFLDPNNFSKDGTTSLGDKSFTEDGSLFAYSISEGGSDWRKIIVMDTHNKNILGDTIRDVKFSGISWKGNDGFFYSSYEKPDGSKLSAKTDQHILYYHKLGTLQKEDLVIFGKSPKQKHRYVGGEVTEDDHYLFISAANTTSGNKLYMMDLTLARPELITILDHEQSETVVLDNRGTILYLITNLNAPNRKISTVDASAPQSTNWKDMVPEKELVLSAYTAGGYLFTHYMKDALSQVLQYDYEGKLIRTVNLPGIGTANDFGGKKKDAVLYYGFANYITPHSLYKYDMSSGKSNLYFSPDIDFNSAKYETTQVFYHSKDGTKIPMIITHKRGIKLNGKNPSILYGYGGFNISLTPSFSTTMAVWLEQGGIYAVANLRGGGEYGKAWHEAGIKMKKQNVFDDFISAAEYLIKNKYTSSKYLAIRGGSNGGLLVGVTMAQRPELMQVVLPAVGVLDMLRYHKFTSGAGWSYDYGTADDSKEMFTYLYGYSPLHNLNSGTSYPATLITTGDHDDRVVPAHSFKFAAELQARQAGKNPVLIRIETNAGHGAGTPVSKIIEQTADIFAFTLYNMGFDRLPVLIKN